MNSEEMNTTNLNRGSIELNSINQQHQIDIVSASHDEPSQSVPINLPCRDLLDDGRREDFIALCVPLYNALINDNFEVAKVILDKRPELVKFSIIESYETALHIAISGRSHQIVDYLVNLMTKEHLELQNGNGETALWTAARDGNVVGARILLERNKCLLDIPDSQGRMPLHIAALCPGGGTVYYLYNCFEKMIGDVWTHQNRSRVLEACVDGHRFDIAIDMVTDHPELAINGNLLRSLAQKTVAFYDIKPSMIRRVINSVCAIFHMTFKFPDKESDTMKLLRIILNEIMKLPKAEIDDIMRGPPDETKEGEKATTRKDAKKKYSSRVLFLAVKKGNTGFVAEVIRQYPYLALEVDDNNQSILHVAASYRRRGIFKLLIKNKHITNSIVTLEDENGNNMFHLVANGNRLLCNQRSSVQLNQEFKWFEAVDSILATCHYLKKNVSGLTPLELFIHNNKDLFSNEEKRIKETANQLMVVAALVATISFAAVFTFPGGYNQDTGIPIFLRKNLSKIFIIFDSLSFISSTTSVLMVLSIINSNYNAYDMMASKPKQLGECVALVFFSIATIILTFLIILFMLYESNSIWMPTVISISAVIPYLMFAFRQYQLRDKIKLW